jgi:TPR repeat protein
MNCIFCRPFKWLGMNGDCVATQRALQEKFQAWRYARTNDQRLFADDPDPVATRKIAELYRIDPVAALPELMALAERGSVWCMRLLAYSYEVGRGAAADLAEAERWYRRALERGSQQAQLRLGRMAERRRDFAECERIYARGVADRWAPAMYYLAQVKLRRPRTSARREEGRRLLAASGCSRRSWRGDPTGQHDGQMRIRACANSRRLAPPAPNSARGRRPG